jgi:DNA-binding transcriptional ArsR family regulator
VEIDWALSGAHRLDKAVPELQELYGHDPDLAERARRLWDPSETMTYPGYLELSLMAHAGGLLFSTNSDLFISRLEKMCLRSPTDLPLRSETPEDRLKLLRRLQLLRSSATHRSRYVEVVSDVWSRLRPLWETEGRAAVQAAMSERSASLAQVHSWEEFSKGDCPTVNLETLMGALGEDGELAVVPAYFNHKRLVVDVPGVVLLSVPAERWAARARAHTQVLARRLKAVSDPTRLAILDALGRRQMNVTEVARMFALAQPTVSNHVKLLRDAGVLSQVSTGPKRLLTVKQEVLNEMVADLKRILEPQSAP